LNQKRSYEISQGCTLIATLTCNVGMGFNNFQYLPELYLFSFF
jgi:hypothetical protein